jgi:predicted small lipoprotein YifL
MMIKKWLSTVFVGLMVVGSLTGCGFNNDDNIGPDDVNYTPVRYDNDNELFDNDLRGPDLDTDPRDVRQPNERDTPFNMDEEEPDLDEEPSEERRGM